MIYETQEQLDAALQEWQKVLQLQDWGIKASVERKHAMELENVNACISWQFEQKRAVVHLMEPSDFVDAFPQDHEEDLVHELLHLHYAGFDDTEPRSLAEKLLEQSINAISRALVGLKRKGSPESKGFSLGELISKEETIHTADRSHLRRD